MKIRLFLLEAELLDTVTLRTFAVGTDKETAIRAALDGKVDPLTFPSAELAPGDYMSDSDAIIERLATANNVDPAMLPTYNEYIAGPLAQMGKLYAENSGLKKQLI